MPRKKKNGQYINLKIDKSIYSAFEKYAEEKGQTKTLALERILKKHLDEYECEKAEKAARKGEAG